MFFLQIFHLIPDSSHLYTPHISMLVNGRSKWVLVYLFCFAHIKLTCLLHTCLHYLTQISAWPKTCTYLNFILSPAPNYIHHIHPVHHAILSNNMYFHLTPYLLLPHAHLIPSKPISPHLTPTRHLTLSHPHSPSHPISPPHAISLHLTPTRHTIPSNDMYAQDSIDMLKECGIQFERHQELGIHPHKFAEYLMTSGVVLCQNVKWISFHRFLPLFVIHLVIYFIINY